MNWKLFKAKSQATKDPKTLLLSAHKGMEAYEASRRNRIAKQFEDVEMKECEALLLREEQKNIIKYTVLDTSDGVVIVMERCVKRPIWFWDCILELLMTDEEMAEKRLEILEWLILNCETERLISFVSKLELSADEVVRLFKKSGYLCETGDLEYGESTIYSMLREMDSMSLKNFFWAISKNELARVSFCENVPTILEAFIDEETTAFSEAFDNIIEFFPECIGKSLHYILNRKLYSDECEIELYALQLVADSRYGYLTSEKAYLKLRDWVRNNVEKLVSQADRENCTSEMIWMLKNEFDVKERKIIKAMIEHAEALISQCENYDDVTDRNGFLYFGDDWEKGIVEEYLMSREGYDLMEDKCYRLARMFPYSVVTISQMFPHADEELLLKVAKEPDNEVIIKML